MNQRGFGVLVVLLMAIPYVVGFGMPVAAYYKEFVMEHPRSER
jgi:hypothetical protein